MCTINKSAHTKKSGNLFNNPRKLVTVVEDDQKAPFSIATTSRCRGGAATPFPGLLHFTLDSYLILLSVKQGGIKYHFFLVFGYDASEDRTPGLPDHWGNCAQTNE